MNMKKILAVILTTVLLLSVMPMGMFTITANAETSGNTTEFAGGSGTEEDPYLISSKIHLNNIRNYPTSCFKQIANISFDNEDFERNGAFYNSGYGWEAFDFSGKYDGNSYVINNLQGENGFFKVVRNAELNNIVLNVKFSYEKKFNYENSFNTGCLAQSVYDALVQGCHISGTLNLRLSGDGDRILSYCIGGIFGYVSSSEILNSSNAVSIGVTSEADGYFRFAGICGWINSETIVRNCKNTGVIDCGSYYAAGIVGYNNGGKIENCKNEGEITSRGDVAGICVSNNCGEINNCENCGKISSRGTGQTGGIVSMSGGTVYGCVNYGDCSSYYGEMGGIVAYTGNFGDCLISKCINYGKIQVYDDFAGGIVGVANSATISECSNYGSVYSENYSSGGIAGKLYSGTITKSSNFGEISSDADDYAAGGICGDNSSLISECYNAGSITDGKNVGGIAGYNYYHYDRDYNFIYGEINNCYNVAKISTKNGEDSNLGGIVGLNEAGVSYCYNISEIDALGNYGGICGKNSGGISNCAFLSFDGLYAVGKGAGEALSGDKNVMQSIETYENFDFNDVWTMEGNSKYPYPELKNVEMTYKLYILGDLDEDEELTDWDGVMLARYLAGWSIEIPAIEALDIDGDGEVTDWDGVVLDRYLAGWSIQIG